MREKVFYKACVLICLMALFCTFLAGCTQKYTRPLDEEPKAVEHVGQVPEEFADIVENNLFYDVTAFDDRLLKTEICDYDEENHIMEQRVWMMDLYGKELASYTCTTDDACCVQTLVATADGGFLFVLGVDERYRDGQWTTEMGLASRVIKCDSKGNLQFDTALADIEGRSLRFCFEKDEKYYFFGEVKQPEKNRTTDIYMAILDKDGQFLKNQRIAGQDFDSLDAAEATDDGFLLSISSQSDDGDFAGSDSGGYGVNWVFTVDEDLQIIQREKRVGRDYFDDRLGEKNGEPVYRYDKLFKNFDAGSVQAFIDYGEFYLIVSENNTGIYENTPPMISSIWFYTETVYSAYDNSGKLIFRAAVDSSPDYDSFVSHYEGMGIE